MLARIRQKISRWASRGPWWLTLLKTALTHGLVVEVATIAGAVLGVVVMAAFGVRPMWAFAFPLLGYAVGFRFYLDRELLGEEADFEKDGLVAKLDAGLDVVVPWLVAAPTLYGLAFVYGLFGI